MDFGFGSLESEKTHTVKRVEAYLPVSDGVLGDLAAHTRECHPRVV